MSATYRSIGQLLDEIEVERNIDRDPRVGPSDYGRCPRQIAYRVRGHELGEPVETSRAATIGTLIHMGIAAFVQQTYPDAARVELPVNVPGLDRPGSADLLWLADRTLVDVKTVSDRAFDYICTRGAKDEHMGQLDTYALGLNRAHVQITTLVIAYVNRENGDVWEHSWDYDESSARQRVEWLVEQEQMIEAGFEMPRARNARLGAFPCDWCPFWRECWDVDETPADRSHASKYTTSDEQIESALERYFAASVDESEAKAVKACARDELVGISYESNGYKLGWSGGRVTYVDEIDHDELVQVAIAKGIEVPMRRVAKTSSRRISAKRQRVTS